MKNLGKPLEAYILKLIRHVSARHWFPFVMTGTDVLHIMLTFVCSLACHFQSSQVCGFPKSDFFF